MIRAAGICIHHIYHKNHTNHSSDKWLPIPISRYFDVWGNTRFSVIGGVGGMCLF